MARQSPTPTVQPKVYLTAEQLQKGIERLEQRITDLNAFDVNTIKSRTSPELQVLERSIEDTLERCFGVNTTAANRYKEAYQLHYHVSFWVSGMPEPNYKSKTQEKIEEAKALLGQAINALKTDLEDLDPSIATPATKARLATHSSRIFLVHGHDEAVRETVARFLEKLGLQVIILHEQANGGRTIIEKIEYHSDVGMAVVLLTPDDVGGKAGGRMEPRVRQNVLLELGYFMGVLGRHKVCALRSGEVEIPTDFAGVVWTEMAGEWKTAIARELKTAGYDIDWNKVMS